MIRTAVIASMVITAIVTVAVGIGLVVAVLAPRDQAFPLVLAVASALAPPRRPPPWFRRFLLSATTPAGEPANRGSSCRTSGGQNQPARR